MTRPISELALWWARFYTVGIRNEVPRGKSEGFLDGEVDFLDRGYSVSRHDIFTSRTEDVEEVNNFAINCVFFLNFIFDRVLDCVIILFLKRKGFQFSFWTRGWKVRS